MQQYTAVLNEYVVNPQSAIEQIEGCGYECEGGIIKNSVAWEAVKKCLAELAEYRNAKKEGRLVELPCKVGDMVYEVAYGCGAKDGYGDEDERCQDCSGKGNCEKEGWHINVLPFTVSMWGNHSHMFGQSIFLTREAAEAAQKAQEGAE